MPRIKKELLHKMWREDGMAIVDGAAKGLRVAAEYAPPAILLGYTLMRILEPIPKGTNPYDKTKERLLSIQTPIVTMLGFFYQGLQGALGAGIGQAVTTMVAPMRFTPKPDGSVVLDIVDALWLASLFPLILGVMRMQPVERGGLL